MGSRPIWPPKISEVLKSMPWRLSEALRESFAYLPDPDWLSMKGEVTRGSEEKGK